MTKKYMINDIEYEADYVRDGYKIEIGDNEIVKINKQQYNMEDDSEKLMYDIMNKGEMIFDISEIVDIWLYKGEYYLFFWDTESNHFFKLVKR